MIIQCKSCQKKFVVDDSAITTKGRIVQCGSCGNKWTQFPDKKKINPTGLKKISINQKTTKRKSSAKKRGNNPQMFTNEYLEKKYGIKVDNNENRTQSISSSKKSTGLGFYGFFIFLLIFVFTFFGILGMSKEYLIYNYPETSFYIEKFYEVVENIYQLFSSLL